MIHCPNCNETIGDDVVICPFCRHEITGDERLQIEQQKREEEREADREESIKAGEFSSLRIIWQFTFIVVTILAAGIYVALMSRDHVQAGLVALIAGLVIILGLNVYFLLIKKANSCPHCGKFLWRNLGTQCQWCGRKIR
ncbi:MAG: hypothetical protein ILP17_01205 [Lachnospiraceae bacterium]|nr:hypothetical protein [Lachnospiraceae bacterium]MBP1584295.1 hypothetical protein [Lachnospiraceae bacterium]